MSSANSSSEHSTASDSEFSVNGVEQLSSHSYGSNENAHMMPSETALANKTQTAAALQQNMAGPNMARRNPDYHNNHAMGNNNRYRDDKRQSMPNMYSGSHGNGGFPRYTNTFHNNMVQMNDRQYQNHDKHHHRQRGSFARHRHHNGLRAQFAMVQA